MKTPPKKKYIPVFSQRELHGTDMSSEELARNVYAAVEVAYENYEAEWRHNHAWEVSLCRASPRSGAIWSSFRPRRC